jgi:acyl-CoA reductase-like NAD-dependent aldehyde dehydrogenase
MKWSSEDDVISQVNNTPFGLTASVWSRDMTQASRIANEIEAGTVLINAHAEMDANIPFAGHKHSGIGVEFGIEGLKSWCNLQTVITKELI